MNAGPSPKIIRRARYLIPWALSLGSSALQRRTPWLVYSARDRIRPFLRHGTRVFEYGSGGSTLWFADLGCEVVSIEHDGPWRQRVLDRLGPDQRGRVSLLLVPPRQADLLPPAPFVSTEPSFRGMSFQDYVSAIEKYPAGHFDVVLIDGRARPDCLWPSWERTRPGGLLVLDDSDRERYRAAMDRLPAEIREDHAGPAACSRKFGQTTLWVKPGGSALAQHPE